MHLVARNVTKVDLDSISTTVVRNVPRKVHGLSGPLEKTFYQLHRFDKNWILDIERKYCKYTNIIPIDQ